jgi:4-amino-4-deoxy-L-arabinose transferase-like glycosyltransferase
MEMFDKEKALLSTILVAVTPLFWLNSLKAMADIPALFFILSTSFFIYKFIRHKNVYNLYLASFLSGVGIGVRFHMFFILLPLLIYTYSINKNKNKHIMYSLLLFLLGTLFWLIPTFFSQGVKNYLLVCKDLFAYRFGNPTISVVHKNIGISYLLIRLRIFIEYFLLGGYGILCRNFDVPMFFLFLYLIFLLLIAPFKIQLKDQRFYFFLVGIVLCLAMIIIFLVFSEPRYLLPLIPAASLIFVLALEKFTRFKIQLKDQIFHFFLIGIVPYLTMVFIFLIPYNPRYLLPLIPALSLIFVLALEKFTRFKIPLFFLLLILILIQSIPLALKIHNTPTAPVQLINYIKQNYNSNETVIILGQPATNRRHFDYYREDFTVLSKQPLPEDLLLLAKNQTVLVAGYVPDYRNLKFKHIKRFYRDPRVHIKHHIQDLYELTAINKK